MSAATSDEQCVGAAIVAFYVLTEKRNCPSLKPHVVRGNFSV